MRPKIKTKLRPEQEKRFNELNILLGCKRSLSNEEYMAALKEIQANYTIALQMRSVLGNVSDTGAITNVIDKIHWLIDSMESKVSVNKDNEVKVKIDFGLDLPDDEKK